MLMTRNMWRAAIAALAAAATTFGVLLMLARYGIDPHHDGVVFKGALDVLAGQVPLRDSYGQYGALLPVVQAAFLGVFGPTLLVLKGSAVVFYAMSAGFLIALWRSVVPLTLAVGMWVLWLAGQPEVTDTATAFPFSGIFLAWSSVYALATSTAACLLLAAAHRFPRFLVAASIASGALVAVTIHLRTPTGLLVGVGLLIGLAAWAPSGLRSVIRSAVIFACALVVANVAIFLWLLVTGTIGDWWQQIIAWPQSWARDTGNSLIPFWEAFARDRLARLVPLMLLVVGVLTLIRLALPRIVEAWRRDIRVLAAAGVVAWALVTAVTWGFGREWARWWFSFDNLILAAVLVALAVAVASVARLLVWIVRRQYGDHGQAASWGLAGPIPLIALFCAASFIQIYPIPDPRHLYWAATPALGLLAWLLFVVVGRRALILVLLGLTVFGPSLASSVDRAATRVDNFSEVPAGSPSRFDGMRVTPAFNAQYGGLMRALEAAYAHDPRAPIVGMTREPLWLTLGTSMANAEKYFLRWGGFPPVAPDYAAIDAFVATERPLILIENWPGFEPQPSMAPYEEIIGYRTAYPRSSASPAKTTAFWLLTPGAVLARPPYRCPSDRRGCVAGPAVPGIVFGP